MDCPITCVPGMENFLRRADLPGSCRTNNLGDRTLQFLVTETINTTRASALILNTFEDLEGPILCQIRSHCPRLYTIGPLHALLKTQISDSSPSVSSNSLWEENKSCIRWLDSKPLRSVVYVSFGSLATMTRDEVLEFWHGLVNSGKPFLWVIRPDLLARKEGEDQILTELVEGTRERAYIVEWAPQEEVLAHPAVGGFLTHSGWNSTLESIYAGVPMICWPYFADQQINSRFVSEVWKLGLDMKDTCDRLKVELMVKEVMERKRDEMIKSAENMAKLARMSVGEGGSSSCNLDKLIQDIRSMFDDRVTGMVEALASRAKIVHNDIDPAEIGKNKQPHLSICTDVKLALEAIDRLIEDKQPKLKFDFSARWKELHEQKLIFPLSFKTFVEAISPQHAINQVLDELTDGNAIISTGIEQNQMWAAQWYKYKRQRQ
uniref:Glycosyltransferase n=1 Tax=Nelumbo nucifera TaxID=4432 RepID=A0A822Y7D3_NELNU|nr:TPA_asm: hypothetical protein HUJ06_029825 [Nelumbo nucifera]